MELTKEKIVETASGLFTSRGFRDVTIDDVCHELGISKKTFYVFYSKKEDLVEDAVDSQLMKRHGMLVECMKGRNPVQVLKVLPTLLDKHSAMDASYSRASYDLKKYYPRILNKISAKNLDYSKAALTEFIDEGVAMGVFRKDFDKTYGMTILSFFYKGFNEYFMEASIWQGRKLSMRAIIATLVDIITHTLLSPQGWKEYEKADEQNASKKKAKARNASLVESKA